MRIIMYIIFAFVFNVSCSKNLPNNKVWEEGGYDVMTEIKHGILVYNGTNVNYKKNGITIVNIRLDEPVVIDVATKPYEWGYFQFPNIYQKGNGNLIATWHMAEDAVSAYGGLNHGIAISKDQGLTWNAAINNNNFIRDYGGALLANGDKIKNYTPKALELETLSLPEAVDTNIRIDGRTFIYYKLDELPDQLQGVYIERLKAGYNSWELEHNTLLDSMAVRYSDNNLFPVVWWGDMKIDENGTVYTGIYPGFSINTKGKVDPCGVDFYKSDDEGFTWELQGRIPYLPDIKNDPNGDKRKALGFTEPTFEILNDGSFICIMRSSDRMGNSGMYISKSYNKGISWSIPEVFTPSGVLPRLLKLKNGVNVLASGRPGMQLRFNVDGKGEDWTDPIEMLPFTPSEVDNLRNSTTSFDASMASSCGYSSLLATGENEFLIVYSDFNHIANSGDSRKAIKVRKVTVDVEK